MRKTTVAALVGLLMVGQIIGVASLPAGAADHLDAPLVQKDGRVDINDIYVFHPGSPGSQDLSRTVLVMTVNPAAGVMSDTAFRRWTQYEFLIDRDGDARADATIRTTFGKVRHDGRQSVTTKWVEDGKRRKFAKGITEEIISNGDATVFAGLRDDPFFFDNDNFNNGATFCGVSGGLPVSNFFLGLDVSALVIEVPTEWIGSGQVGIWGRTAFLGFLQLDQMGRPAINTVFLPPNPFEPDGKLEDAFNFVPPHKQQALFRDEIVNSLTLLFSLNDASDDPSDDAAQIQALADILLPDILTVDLGAETGFLNGRNLADDVIDAELGLITEGLITTDCVDNDSVFLSSFPYLGTPNN